MDDLFTRMWADFLARVGGPLDFRLVLQPAVAVFFAVRSGLRDARAGRPAFFVSFVLGLANRGDLLRQAWRDVGKLFMFAVVLDVIYQLLVHASDYAGETLIIALVLAVLPYVAVRSLANRVAVLAGVKPALGSQPSAVPSPETAVSAAPVSDQAHLAAERTCLAYERTMLAYVRTGTSMIAFGFGLYKFFMFAEQQQTPEMRATHILGPRSFGMLMIAVGLVVLAVAVLLFRGRIRQLQAQSDGPPFSPATVLATLVSMVGSIAFLAALYRQ
jgi:uncharacterized membrane protein YidH (DUF202 family)